MRIGYIETGVDDEGFEARFGPMVSLFAALLDHPELELVRFAGHEGRFPTDLDPLDGCLIPGALASAYDDTAWVRDLREQVVPALHSRGVPLVGVCFGQQVIAQALGGQVRQSSGWEVGLRQVEWTREGPLGARTTRVYECHQDEVIVLPPGAVALARNASCEIQAFHLGERILCLQGHPEFTPEVAEYFLDVNDIGLDDQTRRDARQSLRQQSDHSELGRLLREFFLQGGLAPAGS